MSIIDTINNAHNVVTPPSAAGTTPVGTGAGAMDQNDFLRLMTTQLTTQDPFNPVDNTQMVAQMAQFSQVAGIAEMNQSLSRIASSLGGSRLSDAASWIGHSMLVESDIATPLRDGTYAGEFSLPDGADSVTVSFQDSSGAVVHSQTMGPQAVGNVAVAWDGKNDAGEAVEPGPVTIEATANLGGKREALSTSVYALVQSVSTATPNSPMTLDLLGIGSVTFDKVQKISS